MMLGGKRFYHCSKIGMHGGVLMRVEIIAVTVFILSLLIVASNAQMANGFQNVGGDFGKTWISNFLAQNPRQSVENNSSNNPWSWAPLPKGKALVGGKLVDASPTNTVNFTANWLGELPQTAPIYMNSSSPYGNYGVGSNGNYNPAPLTPMSLSDDPWILAQQLERPVITPPGYYGSYPYQ
jgi:hypothetical protein